MIGDKDDIREVDGEEEHEEFADTMELEAESKAVNSDNVGEPSVELNVEEIIAELEADMGVQASDEHADARKRLEELLEERRATKELDELDEFTAEKV